MKRMILPLLLLVTLATSAFAGEVKDVTFKRPKKLDREYSHIYVKTVCVDGFLFAVATDGMDGVIQMTQVMTTQVNHVEIIRSGTLIMAPERCTK